MSINITSLESALQSKLNAATGSTESKEFLLLTKALESLNSGAVSEVATTGDLPTASDNTGRVIWVTAETALYVSDGTSWSTVSGLDLTSGGTVGGNLTVTGNLNVQGTTTTIDSATAQTVDLGDNDKIQLGDSNDLQIYHDGSHSYVKDLGTGNMYVQSDGAGIIIGNSAGTEVNARFLNDNTVDLYYDNVKKFETTAEGVDVTGEILADSYNETYNAVTSSSNATTVDCHNGNSFSHTLTENTTFTFSNPPASGTSFTFHLKIIQDASASGFTVTWPSSVDWPSATAPTLTATASAVDYFVFTTHDGGTTWYGFTAGQALG